MLSGLNATDQTLWVCPLRVLILFPVCGFHNLIVLSQLPLAKVLPSGLNAIDQIRWECPLKTRNLAPVSGFHSLMVLSQLPLARVFPSGLKAKVLTASKWPIKEII